MKYDSVRYGRKVVDLIMKNDVVFNLLIKKHSNRFVTYDYTVTTFFGSGFVDKMAHFNGPNWYTTSRKISSKYGIDDETTLIYIKEKLQTLFREYEQREVLQ